MNEYKPDYIGFVFAESKRKVSPHEAAKLREKLNPDIIPVGVFVNESIENILRVDCIDMIQLHGNETEEYIRELKSQTNKPVIKAGYSETADFLLFDNPEPGSGKTFNWDTIGEVQKPFFLAGGLSLNNIKQAVKEVMPFAVDVSSGVENPEKSGFKDPEKIKEFIWRVRNEY